MMNIYKTISRDSQVEIAPIKKSRFIAYAFNIESEQNVLDSINLVKTNHRNANHYCWAYTLARDNKFRFNDDGEPNGSAGKPILSHIQGNNLFNVLIVVIRYFGGTKLGVGGLIRAYGQAAKEVLDLADIVDIRPRCNIYIEYEYFETANIDTLLKRYDVIILDEHYSDSIELSIQIDTSRKIDFIREIANVTKAKVKMLDED